MDIQPSPSKTQTKTKWSRSSKWTLGILGAIALVWIGTALGGGDSDTTQTAPVLSPSTNQSVNTSTNGNVLGDSVEVTPETEPAPVANEETTETVNAATVEPEPTPTPTPEPEPVVIPEPEPAPTQAVEPEPVDTQQYCCKVCTTGKACGDSCISRSYTCHKGPGCACDAY